MTTVAYCAVSARGTHRRQLRLDAAGGRARAAAAHRGRPRRGRGDQRPDRARRPGGQRPVQQATALAPGGFDPIAMRFAKQADPRRHRRRIAEHCRRPPGRRRGRLRRRRDPPRPQLSAQLVPEPAAQPPHRRVRRVAGEPGQGCPRHVLAVRREVERLGPAPIAVTAKLNMADGVRGRLDIERVDVARKCRGRRRPRRPRADRRAARCPTRCTCSAVTPHCSEFAATLPQPLRSGMLDDRQAVPARVPLPRRPTSCATPASSARRSTCR